jgi:hypothetical protein
VGNKLITELKIRGQMRQNLGSRDELMHYRKHHEELEVSGSKSVIKHNKT